MHSNQVPGKMSTFPGAVHLLFGQQSQTVEHLHVQLPEVTFPGTSSSSIWPTISNGRTSPCAAPVGMMSYKDSEMERYRDIIHSTCSSQEHCKSLLTGTLLSY